MSDMNILPRPEIPQWLLEAARIPNGPFPLEAMRAVWNRGDEIEEVLLAYVRWLADGSEPAWTECEDDGWLAFIGFYLLADRGCRGLFEPLVKIARDEEYADFMMGDSMTEDLSG